MLESKFIKWSMDDSVNAAEAEDKPLTLKGLEANLERLLDTVIDFDMLPLQTEIQKRIKSCKQPTIQCLSK